MHILQQWLMSQRRTGNVSISPNAGSLKPLQHQYDSPNQNPYQNDNSGASAPNVQWPSAGHDNWGIPEGIDEHCYECDDDSAKLHWVGTINAFTNNQQNAARLAGSQLDSSSACRFCGGNCQMDVKTCPGLTFAKQDSKYKPGNGTCRWRCGSKKGPICNGNNHFAAHHRAQVLKEKDQAGGKGPGKGGGGKGFIVHVKGKGKGKGKGGGNKGKGKKPTLSFYAVCFYRLGC